MTDYFQGASALGAWEEQKAMDEFYILDGSRWQWGGKSDGSFDPSKPPDLAKAKAAGVVAVWWRATYGNFYTDPSFELTYQLAKDVGIPFGAYHVVSPDCDPSSQIDRFYDVCIDMRFEIPSVLDCELSAGRDQKAVTACIQKLADLMYEPPVIYTRQSWWDSNVLPWSGWSNLSLWAARYSTALSSPWSDGRYKFRDWSDWTIWQWSADGNGRGAEFGMRSASVDLDRYNGTLDQFKEFAGITEQPEPEPEPLTIEERVAKNEADIEYIKGYLNL